MAKQNNLKYAGDLLAHAMDALHIAGNMCDNIQYGVVPVKNSGYAASLIHLTAQALEAVQDALDNAGKKEEEGKPHG